MSKIDLVGKVIKHNFQAFLVLEELDEAYVGFWVTGVYKSEPEEISKDSLGEPEVLADSMDAFVTRQASAAVVRAMESKYVGKVCHKRDKDVTDAHGIVTEIKDGMCLGVTFDGAEWSSKCPVVVANSLTEYLNEKVREQVEKI